MKTNPQSFASNTAPTPTPHSTDTDATVAPRVLRRPSQATCRRPPGAAPVAASVNAWRAVSPQRTEPSFAAGGHNRQNLGIPVGQLERASSLETTPLPMTSARAVPPPPFAPLPVTPVVAVPASAYSAARPGRAPADTEQTLEETARCLGTAGLPGPSARDLSYWTYAQQDAAGRLLAAQSPGFGAAGGLGSPIVLRDVAYAYGVPGGRQGSDSPPPLFVGDASTSLASELWRQPFALPDLWDQDESDDERPQAPQVLSPGRENDPLLQRLGPALELTAARRTSPEDALRASSPDGASPGEQTPVAERPDPMDVSPPSPASSGGSSFGCAGALRFDAR